MVSEGTRSGRKSSEIRNAVAAIASCTRGMLEDAPGPRYQRSLILSFVLHASILQLLVDLAFDLTSLLAGLTLELGGLALGLADSLVGLALGLGCGVGGGLLDGLGNLF